MGVGINQDVRGVPREWVPRSGGQSSKKKNLAERSSTEIEPRGNKKVAAPTEHIRKLPVNEYQLILCHPN